MLLLKDLFWGCCGGDDLWRIATAKCRDRTILCWRVLSDYLPAMAATLREQGNKCPWLVVTGMFVGVLEVGAMPNAARCARPPNKATAEFSHRCGVFGAKAHTTFTQEGCDPIALAGQCQADPVLEAAVNIAATVTLQ